MIRIPIIQLFTGTFHSFCFCQKGFSMKKDSSLNTHLLHPINHKLIHKTQYLSVIEEYFRSNTKLSSVIEQIAPSSSQTTCIAFTHMYEPSLFSTLSSQVK